MSNIDTSEPSLLKPNSEKQDPTRKKPRMDIELPVFTQSKADNDEPSLAKPYMDTVDPTLKKPLKLRVDPRVTKSSTDNALDNKPTP
jgi:hypothetical protein